MVRDDKIRIGSPWEEMFTRNEILAGIARDRVGEEDTFWKKDLGSRQMVLCLDSEILKILFC